jgi:hypothetical protein
MSMSKREVAEQLAHERRMLAARRATLNAAQEQAASYGLNVPLDLVNVQRQLAEQIAAHRQEIARLEALEPTAPDAPIPATEHNDQPLWEGLGLGAGGDMIIADVGAGAQNVAVGKNISQHNAGAPADERAEVESALAALEAALRGLDGAAPLLSVLPLQIGLLRGELTKTPPDTPSASTLTQVGDWLIAALPASTPALARLFAAPAARRALERAGPQAVAWAGSRIGVA